MIKFSIVIAVRNINDYLKENIKAIKNMEYKDYEAIIVLDKFENFSTDDPRFIFVESGPIAPGEKRNIGVTKSTGDVVVFLDDDAYPETTWLTKAADIFKDGSIFALGGPALTPKDASFLERLSGYVIESPLSSGFTTYRHKTQNFRYIDDYPTVNLFVRRDLFIKVGGFSKDFWPGEDTKLCLDIVRSTRKKFLYDPEPIVYHHRRKLFLPYLKQISRYGQHRGQFARIYPENSRVLSYFIPSLFIIGLTLGSLTSLISPILFLAYKIVVGIYLTLLLIESTKVLVKDVSVISAFTFAFGVFATHVVYGINFLLGFIRRPKLKLKAVDPKTGNYSEG